MTISISAQNSSRPDRCCSHILVHGLPKARPILCNDCPDSQRLQISDLWVTESLDRVPSLLNTNLKQKVYYMVLHRPIESTAFVRRLATPSKFRSRIPLNHSKRIFGERRIGVRRPA